MADQETICPACGEDTGHSKYCPFCGERVFKEAPGEQPTASMSSIEPVESSTPPETPPPPGFAPPPEVAAPHGSTAAPDLAGPPRVAPPPVMKASPPVFKGPTQALPAEPRKKKRTGLAVALILIAVLCIGGAVAAVFLLTGNGKTSLTIQSPFLKGLQAVDSGGDYAAEFDRGAKAKASFDAAWPSFLAACRSKGVSI